MSSLIQSITETVRNAKAADQKKTIEEAMSIKVGERASE